MGFKKVLLSILALFFVVTASKAQSSALLQKQREQLTKEIAELQKVLQNTTKERKLSQQEVNALSKQLNLREEKISTINAEVRLIDNQISSNNKAVDALKAELEKLRKDYEKMIMFAFRNKNAYSKMMFIFASKDFNQAYRRVKYLQQFNDSRKIKADEIEATQNKIKQKIAQLQADKNKKNVLLKDQQNERSVIAKDKAEHSKVLNELASQERNVKSQLSKKQQQERKLAAQIKAAIAREIAEERRRAEAERKRLAEAEARKTGKTVAEVEKNTKRKSDGDVLKSTPEAARLSADFKSNRGRLPWPVGQGNIIRKFGMGSYGRNVTVYNPDIVIRTGENATIKAVFPGTVVQAFTSAGSGNVIINHGEYFTVYSDMKGLSVSKGQKVSAGQAIGTAGEDTEEGISLVKFSIFQGMTELNPESWLAR
ncbi:murein hydrolase activator EnvC family protein [Sphingobacterium spiritivorum]|uniref:Peptidase, M23 family n=3 Tax=Sphingobacterium spiritivorum TaxID=258 RepID=D7VNF5_SPHSI|nr:peptidoglycan DD-metalloendopeptidase family protein [Sphingobacterium spiritivorum]EEI93907.1 peptidase, M23 family [Sphingobacterium spiritivorum ATCC 33300]EFK57452.1 peptidase, M23 family [Sphingobacterium spiritivorum ATCC 33861]QQS94465.1 peptidoglycan DD-metalloendopeptidase family protein [Sphingobacterium spiritivorum]QQT36478.1 peptidoglycan DD-metalloendopeptidase family protein [Sphingobacterium spiritivorum]WQD33230.1 peptidoglycan DD-metalloendopeptidase family protein [Sphing